MIKRRLYFSHDCNDPADELPPPAELHTLKPDFSSAFGGCFIMHRSGGRSIEVPPVLAELLGVERGKVYRMHVKLVEVPRRTVAQRMNKEASTARCR